MEDELGGGMNEEQSEAAGASESIVPRMSGMAVAALVLGILGIFTCVTAPLGLILGIVAIIQISREPSALRGMGMAVAGTILSGFAIVMTPIIAAILFPVFFQATREREKARTEACLSNVKQISLAMMMYEYDYDGALPPAKNWQDALSPYVKDEKVFRCPAAKSNLPSYGFNVQLSALPMGEISSPGKTVMIFESTPGKNMAGGPELLPSSRHRSGYIFAFADGSARAVKPSNIANLIWWDVQQKDGPMSVPMPTPCPPSGG